MKDLCEENKYPHNLDVTEIFDIWEGHKHDNILTYRWYLMRRTVAPRERFLTVSKSKIEFLWIFRSNGVMKVYVGLMVRNAFFFFVSQKWAYFRPCLPTVGIFSPSETSRSLLSSLERSLRFTIPTSWLPLTILWRPLWTKRRTKSARRGPPSQASPMASLNKNKLAK